MSVKKILVRKSTYFDSVSLMRIGEAVKKESGVLNVVVGMGTDFNIDSLKRLDLFAPELNGITPNDLVIAVLADNAENAQKGAEKAEKLLTERVISQISADYSPPTLKGAIELDALSNVVLISVPGRFAGREVRTALESGKHVMLFSDNVSVEEEIELKDEALRRGLLMMGPDCGTTILNGVPLAFSNVVRRGDIGVVAASGTGLQEVTSLIHRFGCGITQAIGVGGRDLSERVSGRMTIFAAKALGANPATKVILLVSKPPAPSTEELLFSELKSLDKPIVIYFIGADSSKIKNAGFEPADNLENAAAKACELSSGTEIIQIVSNEEISKKAVKMQGRFIRGLYSGGTLCDEMQRQLLPLLGTIYSNTPVPGAKKLSDIHRSEAHTIIDLGDDDFTRGRAHPMIDPTARIERLQSEFADASAGMILFDVVLGYGSHPDMAGAMSDAIVKARKETNRNPILVANILGTDEDPQNYGEQVKKLSEIGVHVFPSNISVARFVSAVIGGLR